ncbi:MAG: hypothetical protein WBW53_18015 [Terriglobales bacterium]
MKNLVVVVSLLFPWGLMAQSKIPTGTILPVRLNSSLRSNKAKPNQFISGRIMQEVPLSDHSRIHAGTRITGHVVAVEPAIDGSGAKISVRFDTLIIGKRRIPITTDLRALATMMDISQAQVPESGPDRGTSEDNWTTEQVGGQVDYHGAVLADGLHVVGKSVPDGVLAQVASKDGAKCRGEVDDNDRPQALWVFSSDACGLYDFRDVVLAHAGRTDPVGEIRLVSSKGNLNIRAGSGMLLRVN